MFTLSFSEFHRPKICSVCLFRSYNSLEIVNYQLNFTAPVNLTATPLGTVGSVVNFFGGVPERTLAQDELKQLKNASKKYFQQVVNNIALFIADPLVPYRL